METWSETTDENTYYDRAAGKSEFDRSTDSRNGNGNWTENQSEHYPDKDGGKVGVFQCTGSVSQYFFDVFYRFCFTYHSEPVTQLED